MKELWLVELNNQSMMSLIAAQCLSTTPPLSILSLSLSLSFSIIDAGSGHRKETLILRPRFIVSVAQDSTRRAFCCIIFKICVPKKYFMSYVRYPIE